MTPAGFHRPALTPQPRPTISRAYADALRRWVRDRAEEMQRRKEQKGKSE